MAKLCPFRERDQLLPLFRTEGERKIVRLSQINGRLFHPYGGDKNGSNNAMETGRKRAIASWYPSLLVPYFGLFFEYLLRGSQRGPTFENYLFRKNKRGFHLFQKMTEKNERYVSQTKIEGTGNRVRTCSRQILRARNRLPCPHASHTRYYEILFRLNLREKKREHLKRALPHWGEKKTAWGKKRGVNP